MRSLAALFARRRTRAATTAHGVGGEKVADARRQSRELLAVVLTKGCESVEPGIDVVACRRGAVARLRRLDGRDHVASGFLILLDRSGLRSGQRRRRNNGFRL